MSQTTPNRATMECGCLARKSSWFSGSKIPPTIYCTREQERRTPQRERWRRPERQRLQCSARYPFTWASLAFTEIVRQSRTAPSPGKRIQGGNGLSKIYWVWLRQS
ncbi:hypothetical protein RvY_10998-2 [Ramazzottius varieornatus]|uniref:Uncharacterized protein n=1 Tax=Ramazzottius varieornatus TaxID=947166 RepID=A0A1D1VEP4_RAMVA|nr:hypothetical protein RvY_10998-2 [Ramazzottius varieornatus]